MCQNKQCEVAKPSHILQKSELISDFVDAINTLLRLKTIGNELEKDFNSSTG